MAFERLKIFFKERANGNGPHNPSPAEREKLETLGYKFEKARIPIVHAGYPEAYDIIAPSGRFIGSTLFRYTDEDRQYYNVDYPRARSECKTGKQQGPKP